MDLEVWHEAFRILTTGIPQFVYLARFADRRENSR